MSLETTATQVRDRTSVVAALAWSHSLAVLRHDSRDLRGDAQFADLRAIRAGTLDAMTGDMKTTTIGRDGFASGSFSSSCLAEAIGALRANYPLAVAIESADKSRTHVYSSHLSAGRLVAIIRPV